MPTKTSSTGMRAETSPGIARSQMTHLWNDRDLGCETSNLTDKSMPNRKQMCLKHEQEPSLAFLGRRRPEMIEMINL